jgi:hypothetical protein
MKTIDQIERIIAENRQTGQESYKGLSSAEIGSHSRSIMFGADGEGMPDDDEWRSWTD